MSLVNKLVPPMRWYEGLTRYQSSGIAHVLATIIAINGSAPRALQAKMVITDDGICDTIGGGGLEHDVITTARQLLAGKIDAVVKKDVQAKAARHPDDKTPDDAVRRDSVYTKHYPLGAKLAQCCGGSVTVMFECFYITPPLSILVFGAGHVAAALMTILSDLPCQVDWVDSRVEMFARYRDDDADYQLPPHIRAHVDDEPTDFIAPFLAASQHQNDDQNQQRFILVMTHDHALDFELVRAAVDASAALKGTPPYIGCISSATKAQRFKGRLSQRGYDDEAIDLVTMPIGLPIGGKEPMAVAVSITADILQRYHKDQNHHKK